MNRANNKENECFKISEQTSNVGLCIAFVLGTTMTHLNAFMTIYNHFFNSYRFKRVL